MENDNSLIEMLRSLQKSSIFNRKCANCNEICPNYICINFGTFVCSTCSGIHREFNHKIKSISLSKWNLSEVQNICEYGGNYKDTLKYLKNINPSSLNSITDSSNDYARLKDFIKNKYIECLWIDKHYNDNNYYKTNNRTQYINNTHNFPIDQHKNNSKNSIQDSNNTKFNEQKYIDRNPFSLFL